MEYQSIQVDIKDYILTLTLNRPDKLNAFTVEMANELVDVFTKVNEDDQVRVCLLYTSPSPRDRTRSRMPSSA